MLATRDHQRGQRRDSYSAFVAPQSGEPDVPSRCQHGLLPSCMNP